ncbi:amino acid adenylation domain-containing protein [Streptomyces sp. NPDC058576]|uniref:amino acid adenylation domain-containing protein n=1 Tax=Streptomyces sp. NPDC058576 TaxID=3346547 RepID=UPI0036596AA4
MATPPDGTKADVKKELLKFLLLQVKDDRLDVGLAKEFIKAIGTPQQARDGDEPVAVVGMACRFPGAPDKEAFWANLLEGREHIGDFPKAREEDLRRVDTASRLRRGGYLERIDLFDPEYFGIPPQVATEIDPYHRNLMEVLIETAEDAGYTKSGLYGANVGIFVGNDHTHRMSTSYLQFLSQRDFSAFTGSWSGILASRLAYHLNLRGPATVVDTGCSSGLVALDTAVKALRQGDCDTAFVAAVNLLLAPTSIGDGAESGDCRVRAFDSGANGTVWSEGVAGVYIKPLSRAVADGDHVYGVVLGSAVNNDGRSNGLTAPSAKAQKELLVKAWKRAGIPPETLSYIEAHGTGTALGDPIEIKGLTGAFAEFTAKKQFCGLGSVKTNIGHLVGAAGLASLIKVFLCLDRGVIPGSLHFDVPNDLLDLPRSPVYVQDRTSAWESTTPRRAGVSSFSLSGTNCHVVLEEAPAAAPRPQPSGGFLFPLSARNEELLAETAARHLAHLDRNPEYRLDDVCFTVQTGREHQPVRAVVLCDSRAGLREGLSQVTRAYEGGGRTTPGCGTRTNDRDGQTERFRVLRGPAATPLPEPYRHLADAVTGWFAARPRPFAALHQDADARRVPLPAQLFHHVRLWDESTRPALVDAAEPPDAEDPNPLSEPSRLHGEEDPAPARRALARVWSDVLGYPVVRGTDDFFALGGDSISSLRITQTLNAVFALEIPPATLLADRVFDDFAEAVVREHGLTDALVRSVLGDPEPLPVAPEVPGGPEPEAYELPLTAAQRSVFFASRRDEESVAYNEGGLVVRRDTLDAAALEAGLRVLVARHDSLRATFHTADGVPFQRVHPNAPVSVETRRLAAPGPGESHESLARAQMRDFVRPFRLDTAPLLRAACFAFDDGVTCLAIDMHHIVTDGASMGVLFRELAAVAEGTPLPPLPKSYRTAWGELLSRQERGALTAQRKHWAGVFAEEPPVLRLPTDLRRSDTITARGAKLFTTLDGPLLDAAKRWAAAHDITPYMLFLGVFQQLLSRVCGQRDMVIGAPVMGRPDLTYQSLIGMFVNTLPLRLSAGPQTGIDAFFRALKSTVLDAFAHQDYPLELIVEDLAPPREPGRRPLFDVCFVHQNADMGMRGERLVPYDDGSAKYDLTLSTRETDDGLVLMWEYATSLFRPETIALWAERYEQLLRSVITAEDGDRLDGLALVPAREQELLRRIAEGPAGPVGRRDIVRLFEDRASADPDKAALISGESHADGGSFGEGRLSYGELNARANRIAHGLIQQGSAPGSPVALLMDRSFDMVAAILGVLKARCHYVPLNTGFPADRLRLIVEDSGAGVLLASAARLPAAAGVASEGLRILALTDVQDYGRAAPGSDGGTADPGLPGGADDPVYIMYTSGTTGAPKGALIRQRGVLRVAHRAAFADADPSDTFLLLSDYSFDGSVYDMYAALVNGASLVVTDRESVLDVHRLGETIRRHGVTRFFITMSMFNTLVDYAPDALTGVRRVICGGEAASPTHIRKAFDLLGPGRIANGYGPTETTVFAAVHVFDTLDDHDAIPIGNAITGTSLRVLDDRMRPVPIGTVGELYIGGSGLADGYLNRAELTEERFVTSTEFAGERLYRTGDLATFRSNGLLYYHGRVDQQVKLRGYRIEPAEIEAAALAEPYVGWAHAGVHASGAGGRTLCLWVRYSDEAERDGSRLRSALRRRLPDYMVPPLVVATDKVPLNKNGKVDVAALPEPVATRGGSTARPVGELQQRMAAAWSHVLGVPVDDIDANFFELGGDSIKAMQIVAKLKEHGIEVRAMDLLEHQTTRLLAQRAADTAPAASHGPGHPQEPLSGPVLPGPVQQDFLAVPENHAQVYNQSLLITLDAPCPTERLASAVQRLVRYHDMLRIEIDALGGLRIRDVDAAGLLHVREAPADLAEADLPGYLADLQAQVDVQGGAVVALATGLGKQRRQLALAVHHMAVDVVSWGILVEDLLTCLSDPGSVLPPKTMPFPAWTAELRRHTEEGGFHAQLPYWKELARRAEHTGPLFETDDEWLVRGESDAELLRLTVTTADGASLFDAARRSHGAGPADVLVAVVARALSTVCGRNQVLLTMEGHGREPLAHEHDLSRTVGWFTSTFPHLVDVADDVRETVASVRDSFARLPAKGVGFGPLLRFGGRDDATLARVRPQVSFNYLGDQTEGHVGVTHLARDLTTDAAHRSPCVLDITAHRTGDKVVVEVRHPRAWTRNGTGPAVAEAIRASFHQVSEVLTDTDGPVVHAPSIDRHVVDDILADLLDDI